MDLQGNPLLEKAEAKVAELTKQLNDAKRAVNMLYTIVDQPPPYEIEDEANAKERSLKPLRSDEYFGLRLSAAIELVLERLRKMGRDPIKFDDIFDTLEQGGFNFSSVENSNKRNGVSVALSKGKDVFVKLPNGGWALRKWYPKSGTTPVARRTKKVSLEEQDDELSENEAEGSENEAEGETDNGGNE